MRVIAGKFRSRPLRTLRGNAMRPTSDRLRGTLFDILGAGVEGACFIDMFAGTGAMGIEALSRGARQAFFIEQHKPAVALIRHNLDSLRIHSDAEIILADAVRGGQKLAVLGVTASYIFVDPPYAETAEYHRVIHALGASTLLAPEGLLIFEHARRADLFAGTEDASRGTGLVRVRTVIQGDAAMTFFRRETGGSQTG
jgi:16S rRNA (guanine966-N2)-methyltransferase